MNLLVFTERSLFHSLFAASAVAKPTGMAVTKIPLSVAAAVDAALQIVEGDVGLVDVNSDPPLAIQVCQLLRERARELPVVALICCPQMVSDSQIHVLTSIGIHGVIDSVDSVEEAMHVFDRVAKGDSVFFLRQGRDRNRLVVGGTGDSTRRFRQVSSQEFPDADLQILHKVAHGMSDREIGKLMHLSPHTVDHHIERLRQLLSVQNRVELAAWAGLHGFYRPLP